MTEVADLRFVLPGRWISIDVRGSDDVVARRIKDVAARAVGRREELARARRAIRDALTAAVADARVVRADQLHLAQSIMDGIPMSAALAVSRPGISLPAMPTKQARQDALLTLVPGSNPEPVDHPELAIVRSVDNIEAGTEPDGAARLKRLTANYWIHTPSGQLVVFSFSSSMTGLDDELMLLFDAITSSVRQRTDADADADAG